MSPQTIQAPSCLLRGPAPLTPLAWRGAVPRQPFWRRTHAAFKRPLPSSRARLHWHTCKALAEPGSEDSKPDNTKAASADSTELPPGAIVPVSAVFYGLMTAGAMVLGQSIGLPILSECAAPLQLFPAAGYTGMLLAALALFSLVSDRIPALKELDDFIKREMLPFLVNCPWWGVVVLAIGAGVGEEVLFRGLLQSAVVLKMNAIDSMTGVPATALGLGSASIIFGALHAVTPAYFVWATAAGLLFGFEYLNHGLPAAAVTHAMYDFIALTFAVQEANKGPLYRAMTGLLPQQAQPQEQTDQT